MAPPVLPAPLAFTREVLLRHAQALPAAPQVLGSLCELLEDVNTDLDRIAAEVRRDPALAARVVRLGNSVVFGSGARVASIDEAVQRVGFAEIVRLVGIATVAGLVDRALGSYGVPAERLRESLLLHALAGEALAEEAGLEGRAVYTAGLLRGVGMMVLDRAARGRLAPEAGFAAGGFATYAAWERARFGVDATAVTTTVFDEWRFPAEIVAAVEQHLEPGDDPFAHVLNLAGGIVAAEGLALPGEAAWWTPTPEKLAAAGLDAARWDAARLRAAHAFARQRPALY